jgi:DNA uptake protein ComE-like DNA-binding protein
MFGKRLLALAAIMGLAAAPVLAQGTSTTAPTTPAAPAHPAPAATAPKPPAATSAATSPTATAPAAKMVNLNTASATELDTLPSVGKSRSKAILDERAKGNFKDWADFDKRMTGTSVNAGVKSKIKSHVTF